MSRVRPGVVAATLRDIATLLGVDRVGIAVDHPRRGRQVFVDGSRLLGELECLLDGPPRIHSVPDVKIPVGIADGLRVLADAACDTSAEGDDFWGSLDRMLAVARRAERAVSIVFGEANVDALARLRAYSEDHTRVGEMLVHTGPGRFVWVLDAPSTVVPRALARLVDEAGLGRTRYAVAESPRDGCDAPSLMDIVAIRLAETELLDR